MNASDYQHESRGNVRGFPLFQGGEARARSASAAYLRSAISAITASNPPARANQVFRDSSAD